MLSLARVVNAHPESHAVDIVIMSDGRRMSGVQVMSSMAGTNVGMNDLPSPSMLGYGATTTRDRDIFAVVTFVDGVPMVLGFLFPQVSQVLFSDKDRMVYRHASDTYVTIDKHGNTEVAHPSGAFLRIGTTPQHENLTGKDYDKIWKITKNVSQPVHIHIEQAGGLASVDIAPSGAVNIATASSAMVNAAGPVSITSGDSITLTAPTVTINGDTIVNGTVTGSADITAGGISAINHTHPDPQGGSTSPPS